MQLYTRWLIVSILLVVVGCTTQPAIQPAGTEPTAPPSAQILTHTPASASLTPELQPSPSELTTQEAASSSSDSGMALPFDESELTQRLSEMGQLSPGETVTRTVTLENGPVMFGVVWFTSQADFYLIAPDSQVINPAYAAAHPLAVVHNADSTGVTYFLSNAAGGQWQYVLQSSGEPAAGASYNVMVFFGGSVALTGGIDKHWYIPGETAIFTATLSGSPDSAVVTATVMHSGTSTDTVTLTSLGDGQYQGTYLVPDAPGYAEAHLNATGTLANGQAFERQSTIELFQISPQSASLTGSYSDSPQPYTAGGPDYQALIVMVEIDAASSGTLGLGADLVDGHGNFVAHALTYQDVVAGPAMLALRFEGADIYASQRDGPYELTNLLLIDDPLVVAEAKNVYTTSAYRYTQFAPH